jgi:nucleoside-diphosphate-sugar epimerase
MKNKNVAIIGAAGFVGIELVKQLEDQNNLKLFAITRENGSFILDGRNIELLNPKDISDKDKFDVVVNLAYPTSGSPHLYPTINNSILDTIKRLCNKDTRIIHVSTQAVFGFGMDKDVQNSFLKNRKDYPYIEAKLAMENLVNSTFPANELTIVRLGNVWGAASGSWTGSIADKLLFGQYIGVENIDGFANITDVKNAASYLAFLVNLDNLSGRNIYHIAEFSEYKWSYIVDLIAKELNVAPVYSDINPNYSLSLKQDISGTLKMPKVGDTYRELVWGRYSGSYLRSFIRFLGPEKFSRIKKTETRNLPKTSKLSKAEETFLTVVTSQVQFKSELHKDWKPLVDFNESWRLIKEWFKIAGYIN